MLYFPRVPLLCGNRKASHSKFLLCGKLITSGIHKSWNAFKEGLDKVRLGTIVVIKHAPNAVPGHLNTLLQKTRWILLEKCYTVPLGLLGVVSVWLVSFWVFWWVFLSKMCWRWLVGNSVRRDCLLFKLSSTLCIRPCFKKIGAHHSPILLFTWILKFRVQIALVSLSIKIVEE